MQVNPLATLKLFCTTGTFSASQRGLCSIVQLVLHRAEVFLVGGSQCQL